MSTQKQKWTLLTNSKEFMDGGNILIREDEHHYLSNVLRLKCGEEVDIANGNGMVAQAKILSINKKETELIVSQVLLTAPQKPSLSLYLAMPKPSTLEEVVSAASELGVAEIHVFRSEKCMSKAPLKIEKLQRLSDEACRISKSAWSAKLYAYENLNECLTKQQNAFQQGLNLFCDETHVYENKVTNSLRSCLDKFGNKNETWNLIVGPEASFTESERSLILNLPDTQSVSLGSNILRVPNAVISALGTLIQFQMDCPL